MTDRQVNIACYTAFTCTACVCLAQQTVGGILAGIVAGVYAHWVWKDLQYDKEKETP